MPFVAIGSFISDAPLVLFPSLALFGISTWLYFPSAHHDADGACQA